MLCKASTALACAVLLGGCSTLSQTECQSANWKEIGYKDGSRGVKPGRAEEHREACSQHGIAVDVEAWQHGYERGLEVYCTPENALQLGLRGGDYAGVCPPALDLDFTSNWRAGRVVFDQRQRVARLDERRRELEYAYNSATNDQDRYAVRVQVARVDEQLRYERARLYEEETRLRDLLHGVR